MKNNPLKDKIRYNTVKRNSRLKKALFRPRSLVVLFLFILIGGFFVYKSFAATASYPYTFINRPVNYVNGKKVNEITDVYSNNPPRNVVGTWYIVKTSNKFQSPTNKIELKSLATPSQMQKSKSICFHWKKVFSDIVLGGFTPSAIYFDYSDGGHEVGQKNLTGTSGNVCAPNTRPHYKSALITVTMQESAFYIGVDTIYGKAN